MQMAARKTSPPSSVTFQGQPHRLLGTLIAEGNPLPSAELIDAMTMKPVDLSMEKGSVLFLNFLVSLDTPV